MRVKASMAPAAAAVLAFSALLLGPAAQALAATASEKATVASGDAKDGTVSGVVTRVNGGRVTMRLDNGQVRTFSALPGSVKVGEQIQATARRKGDAIRLERIELKAAKR